MSQTFASIFVVYHSLFYLLMCCNARTLSNVQNKPNENWNNRYYIITQCHIGICIAVYKMLVLRISHSDVSNFKLYYWSYLDRNGLCLYHFSPDYIG